MSSFYGNGREPDLTKVDTLSASDTVRVVASGASRNIRFDTLKALIIAQSSVVYPLTTTTTNYILGEGNGILLCDVSGGAITVTLPAASSTTIGKSFIIKKKDNSTNNVNVQANGAETIDGSNSLVLSGGGGSMPSIEIVTDGTEWFIVNA